MRERDGYIPGVPCWVDTSQPDPKAAAAFYGGLFGWELEDAMPPGARQLPHRSPPRRHGGGRRVRARGRPAGGDVEHVHLGAERRPDRGEDAGAGGRVLTEPFDVMEAGRMAVCADPEGAAFCLWQARQHRGAQIVNEPGSLNFNSLNTRDARARSPSMARCSAGRRSTSAGRGMWRLPGYGDFLEQSDPGLRQRMAGSAAAPEGFADVVAAFNPITDDRPETPRTGA